MAERIVIDTGPLVALARTSVLDVIGTLPLAFVCPSEVRTELDEGAKAGHVTVDVPWLQVVSLAAPIDPVSRAALDAGEAAVIQLAIEQAIPIVCIDDRKGRRAALAIGLRITGSLGLLARARTLGLIPALRPVLDRALAAGIWYDADLVRLVLESVGE